VVASPSNIGYDVTIAQRPTAEEDEQRPRRPGRPCQCAERWLPCVHGDRASKKPRPEPARTSQTTHACWKCGRWRIPCIHVRPRISRMNSEANNSTNAPESMT
jgi:hypothetical protein